MNKYDEMINRHQNEIANCPMRYAFGKDQFNDMMKDWGLDPVKDIKKISTIGAGCYFKKTDADEILEMFQRQAEERKEAIDADETGEGYIFDMFYSELANHEYGYTGDITDTLNALGLTAVEVTNDKKLNRGLALAIKKINQEQD